MKGEQEEMCISPEGEQLVLKQETDTLMLTLDYEESDPREPEPDGEHQLLSHNSTVAESQDQNRRKHVDSGSTRNEEPNPQKSHENRSHSNNVYISEINADTHISENSLKCDKGEGLMYNHQMKIRVINRTSEKPYLCKICGKCFGRRKDLPDHMTIHTGERPFSCQKCGKCFRRSGDLKAHMIMHSGERPYSCQTCKKAFARRNDLRAHVRTHTGERPHCCQACGKCFGQRCHLNVHMRTHRDEEPATHDQSFS